VTPPHEGLTRGLEHGAGSAKIYTNLCTILLAPSRSIKWQFAQVRASVGADGEAVVTAMGGHAETTSPDGESVLLNEAVLPPVDIVPIFASGLPLAVSDSTVEWKFYPPPATASQGFHLQPSSCCC
jgi:hypothetical protein